jgi:hypothetical protein
MRAQHRDSTRHPKIAPLDTGGIVGRQTGFRAWALTWTHSRGAESPEARDADTLVAGNAFGTMFIEVRRLGLEMTAEEMVTACKSQHAVAVAAANTGQSGREAHCIHSRCRGALHRPGMSPSRSRTARSAAELTSILVSKIERRALVGHAADVAHLGAEIAECGLVAVGGVAEQVKSVEGTRRAVVERGSNEVLGSRLATSGSQRRSGVACSIRLWLAGALGWATQHGVLKPCSPKVKPVTVAWVKPLYFTGSTGYLFSKWRARVARLESRSRKQTFI